MPASQLASVGSHSSEEVVSHSEEDSDDDDEERDDLHGSSSRDRVDSWTDFLWGVLLTFYAPPVLAMITFSEQYTASWQPENDDPPITTPARSTLGYSTLSHHQMTQGPEYSLLSQEDGSLHHRNPIGRQEAYTTWLTASLAVASLICSVAISVYMHSQSAISHYGTPAGRLEFVSQYIGLDRAIRDPESPPLHPILNFPLLISPINASDPDKAMNLPRKWKSSFGMVYLQERHFTVSGSVSMILQFRTGDFRFEECALIASIPESASPSASGRATALEIWRLEAAEMLRAEDITWSNRPRRSALFAHWDVQGGSKLESNRFNCSWGSFHTFEFVAAASDSSVLFLQDPTEHGKGILIKQYERSYNNN